MEKNKKLFDIVDTKIKIQFRSKESIVSLFRQLYKRGERNDFLKITTIFYQPHTTHYSFDWLINAFLLQNERETIKILEQNKLLENDDFFIGLIYTVLKKSKSIIKREFENFLSRSLTFEEDVGLFNLIKNSIKTSEIDFKEDEDGFFVPIKKDVKIAIDQIENIDLQTSFVKYFTSKNFGEKMNILEGKKGKFDIIEGTSKLRTKIEKELENNFKRTNEMDCYSKIFVRLNSYHHKGNGKDSWSRKFKNWFNGLPNDKKEKLMDKDMKLLLSLMLLK